MLPTEIPEYRVHTKPSLVEHWRHLVEIVALVSAALWAFYVFVYQERIKPAAEPPRLQISTSVTHEPLQSGKELVTIHVSLKNVGSNDIALGALLINAYGLRYGNTGPSGARETHPDEGISIVNKGVEASKPALLYSHLLLRKPLGEALSAYIPVGEEASLPMPFVLERGAYDTVHIIFARCIQRADNRGVTNYAPKRTADGAFDIHDLLSKNDAHPGLLCNGNTVSGGEYPL